MSRREEERTNAELVGLDEQVFGVGEDLVAAEVVTWNDAELLARLAAHVVQAEVLRWNAELRVVRFGTTSVCSMYRRSWALIRMTSVNVCVCVCV